MHDVIYSRDGLDRFVDGWSRQDIRVSFPAWGLKGVLWTVRRILGGTYRGLNLLYLSLSRQMEYNADNVAVSVTGSDALIHGLARLPFATDCLADAAKSLDAAADHGLFTSDLFYHQAKSADRLRRLRREEDAGVPPELPESPTESVQVFQPTDDGTPERYRSHPTDYMREQNAKRIYVRSPQDSRSPWLLFGRADELMREVTGQFYAHALGRREDYIPRPAAEVQEFIDAEHAERTYNSRYEGFYDSRFINPGDLDDLPDHHLPREEVGAWLSGWPSHDLGQTVEAHSRRRSEHQLLRDLHSGELTLKGRTFPFRDKHCTFKDVERLLTLVDQELQADVKELDDIDRQAFLAHWSLTRHLDGGDHGGRGRETELLERYRFHTVLQGLLGMMLAEQARLQSILAALSSNQQFSQDDFLHVRNALMAVHGALTRSLEEAKVCRSPSLTNVPAGSSLYALIVDRDDTALPPLSGDSISSEWLNMLIAGLEGVLTRLKRLHFKSLGSLLTFQERLAVEWGSGSAASV